MKLKRISGILLAIIIILSIPIPVFSESYHYIHDPMANPNAAKDIVVNPDAVYGYSPSPESERLKDYVDYDWTDPTVVAEMQEQREAYHESFQELYDMIDTMKAEGDSIEDIARAVSTRRNELRLEAYDGDPKGLAAYYDTVEYMDGKYVDGKRVNVEAAADLSGMQVILAYAKTLPEYDLKKLFDRAANIFVTVGPAGTASTYVAVDNHPLGYLRVNINAQMFDEFYETYGCEEGDGMYLAPENRIRFWGE